MYIIAIEDSNCVAFELCASHATLRHSLDNSVYLLPPFLLLDRVIKII